MFSYLGLDTNNNICFILCSETVNFRNVLFWRCTKLFWGLASDRDRRYSASRNVQVRTGMMAEVLLLNSSSHCGRALASSGVSGFLPWMKRTSLGSRTSSAPVALFVHRDLLIMTVAFLLQSWHVTVTFAWLHSNEELHFTFATFVCSPRLYFKKTLLSAKVLQWLKTVPKRRKSFNVMALC